MSKLTPRPYQQEDLDAAEGLYKQGHNRLLYHAATGLGKGVYASFLPGRFPRLMEEGMLVLVPRREIAFQMQDNFRSQHPDLKVGIEMGSMFADGDEDILIVSSHTLGRRDSDRIERFMTSYGIIVNDEAHHSYAGGTHDNILSWFGQGSDVNVALPGGIDPLVVHMTATPEREDEHTIAPFCDRRLASRGIKFGIENGWLVPIDAHRVTEARTGGVTDMDGYEADLLVRAYEDFGLGKRVIAFAPSVESAKLAMRRFEERGIPAGFVSGEECMYRGEEATRSDVLRGHKEGGLRVVTNYGVLVEGYDDPGLQGIVMGRDLSSERLYTQIMGRALRPSVGVDAGESAEERRQMIADSEKPAAHIIDIGENVNDLQMQVTAPNVMGIDDETYERLDTGEDLVIEVMDVIDELDEEQEERDLREADPDEIELAAQGVDVWSQTVYNDRLKSFSSLRWVKWGDDETPEYALYVPEPPEEDSRFAIDKRNTIVYLKPESDATGSEFYTVVKIDTGGGVQHRGIGWRGQRADAEVVTTVEKEGLSDYMKAVEQQVRPAVEPQGAPEPASDEQVEALRDAGFSIDESTITDRTATLLLDYHKVESKIDAIRSGEDGTKEARKILT